MEEYKVLFTKFKDKSSKLLEAINNEDYDLVNKTLGEREELLEIIKTQNFSKEIFKEMNELFNIQDTETIIKALLAQKLSKVNGEMQKLQLTSKANNSYNKSFYDRNKIFSKKV